MVKGGGGLVLPTEMLLHAPLHRKRGTLHGAKVAVLGRARPDLRYGLIRIRNQVL